MLVRKGSRTRVVSGCSMLGMLLIASQLAGRSPAAIRRILTQAEPEAVLAERGYRGGGH